MTTSRTRLALGVGSAGLVAGLTLGITGFAGADPQLAPADHRQKVEKRFGDRPGFGKHHLKGAGGQVVSLSGNTLTVRSPRETRAITLNGDTTYYVGKTKASKGNIDTGDRVHIRLVDPRADKPVAAVVTVVPARIGGWVTAVGSDSLTLRDLDGFTRTINTSSSTTYAKNGETASRSVVAVGAFVHAIGEVASDGTSLDATRVGTGQPRPGRHQDGPRDEEPAA